MQTKKEEKTNVWVALIKFVPLLVFAVMVIVFKMDLLLAAPIGVFTAVVVYMILYKAKFEQAFEQCLTSVKKIVLIFFILMFAYGVAECFMAAVTLAAASEAAVAPAAVAAAVDFNRCMPNNL